jgi:hypothetical protein
VVEAPCSGKEETDAKVYTAEDLTRVANHLARPDVDHSDANDVTMESIGQAMIAGRPLSEGEKNFMSHDLAEADLMDGGMSYEDAHALALQQYPLGKNYTPEVIRQFPEFGPFSWRAWGMR